jgi:hypothetical protein
VTWIPRRLEVSYKEIEARGGLDSKPFGWLRDRETRAQATLLVNHSDLLKNEAVVRHFIPRIFVLVQKRPLQANVN